MFAIMKSIFNMNNRTTYTVAGIGIILILVVAIGFLLWQRGYFGTKEVQRSMPMKTSYKTTPIPEKIYTDGDQAYEGKPQEDIDLYVDTFVTKYYTYKDVLLEHNIPISPEPETMSLGYVVETVPQLEQQIEDNLVSTADFAYIKAKYRLSPSLSQAEKKFPDLKAGAMSMINQFRERFLVDNPDVEDIVNLANEDYNLQLLNYRDINEVVYDYRSDERYLFYTDPGFNEFLFEQEEGVVSEPYELMHEDGEGYAYVIVYPMEINKRTYISLPEALGDRNSSFEER